jgi:hypothetical protein
MPLLFSYLPWFLSWQWSSLRVGALSPRGNPGAKMPLLCLSFLHKKSRIPYIKVYGFFIVVVGADKYKRNAVIFFREGRPQSQLVGSVAPTVRLLPWWHNW